MEAGKKEAGKTAAKIATPGDPTSPIVRALAAAEASTTGEIRVHLSKRLIERNPFAHAQRLFERFGMTGTRQRNAVLVYINLRRHRLAIVGDQGIHQAVGQPYWEKLGRELSENLRSTHPERAIAMAVAALGDQLARHFPKESL